MSFYRNTGLEIYTTISRFSTEYLEDHFQNPQSVLFFKVWDESIFVHKTTQTKNTKVQETQNNEY